MILKAGRRLGPYEIVGPLGAGGMGEVYRARDPRLGRDVAIKVLKTTADAERLRRFEQEARASGSLSHPNILDVHDVGVAEGIPYLVSEVLEGEPLRERFRRGPLPPRKAIEYGIQIAMGLAAAHEKGIVHRDLKPENLFLRRDGQVKILDFGLAKLGSSGPLVAEETPTRTRVTEPGTILGTEGYMSPEHVRGEDADARTDIFALGAVLHEMLTGKRAFDAPTTADTLAAILREDPAELARDKAGSHASLDRVVRTAPGRETFPGSAGPSLSTFLPMGETCSFGRDDGSTKAHLDPVFLPPAASTAERSDGSTSPSRSARCLPTVAGRWRPSETRITTSS